MDKSPYIQKSSEITKIGRLDIYMDQLEYKGVVRPYSYASVPEGMHVLPPLGYVYPSYGYTDEKVHLFAAICSNKINKSLEPLEVIESDLYTFDEVDQMVEDGRISLGNAILCWIRYKKRIDRQGK